MSGKLILLLPSEHWLITLVCSWKNYYETDIIDGWMYKYVQDNAMDKLVHANEFYDDLKEGTLPQFSYINPECWSTRQVHPYCQR